MLCEACQICITLLLTDQNSHDSIRHQHTSKSLKNSKQQGCTICRALYEEIEPAKPGLLGKLRSPLPFTFCKRAIPVKIEPGNAPPNEWCWLFFKHNETRGKYIRVDLDPDIASFDSARPYANKIPHNTNSALCFSLARRWLDTCLSDHTCIKNDAPNQRPTRLLDLQGSDIAKQAKLVITATTTLSNAPYITLSHCWGAAKTIKLLIGNEKDLRSGFPIDSLPTTYKDAIQITRSLGIRYLWIDSLCIIQDSSDDWLREAAMMDTVYARSFCNIAALDAADSNGGCFFERDPTQVGIDTVEVHHPAEGMSQRYRVLIEANWDEALGRSPLYNRAWVLQERALPPRTLLYGRKQIYWECRNHAASEGFPNGLPERLKPHATVALKQMPGRFHTNCSNGNIWDYLVEHYSRGNLTHLGDKLVAISGLACIYGPPAEGYLAGVWRGTLLKDLLWQVGELKQSNGDPSFRPRDYRAPSWSWASVEGDINYTHRHTEHIIARVIEAQTTPLVPRAEFGKVTAGHVRISGPFGQADLVRHKENKQLFFQMRNIMSLCEDANPSILDVLQQTLCAAFVWLDEYQGSRPPLTTIYWVLISTSKGLALSPSSQAGSYQRIGMFAALQDPNPALFNYPFATISIV